MGNTIYIEQHLKSKNNFVFADGSYQEEELKEILYSSNGDFKNENELRDHVFDNLEEVLNEKIYLKQKEFNLPRKCSRAQCRCRADIVASSSFSDCRRFVIECKLLKSHSIVELVQGIAQLQLYGMIYGTITSTTPRLVLICNKIDNYLIPFLKEFAPEVVVLIVNKKYIIKCQIQNKNIPPQELFF
jgi:hypothetical protein